MATLHEQPRPTTLLPGRIRPVVEGLAALITLVALVSSLCGIATWAAVELVRAFV